MGCRITLILRNCSVLFGKTANKRDVVEPPCVAALQFRHQPLRNAVIIADEHTQPTMLTATHITEHLAQPPTDFGYAG